MPGDFSLDFNSPDFFLVSVIPVVNKLKSNADYSTMQVLGYGTNANLYWDYGNSENFFYLDKTVIPNQLYSVSPAAASTLFANVGTVVYNPFGAPWQQPLSNVVQ